VTFVISNWIICTSSRIHFFVLSTPVYSQSERFYVQSRPPYSKSGPPFLQSGPPFLQSRPPYLQFGPSYLMSIPLFVKSVPLSIYCVQIYSLASTFKICMRPPYVSMGPILFLQRPSILQSVQQFLCKILSVKYHPYEALHIKRYFFIRHPLTNKPDPCKNMRASYTQSVVWQQWARTINQKTSWTTNKTKGMPPLFQQILFYRCKLKLMMN